MMISTMEELRQHLSSPSADTHEAAHRMLAGLESAFSGWEEDTMGALLVDIGMLLGTRRGAEGAASLTDAVEALGVLLMHHQEARRKMN